jgi:hypothetical protein
MNSSGRKFSAGSRSRFCLHLGLILLVLLLAALIWEAVRSREPSYGGKGLSVWLRNFEEARLNGPTSRYHLNPAEFQVQFVEPTQDAIRHMGTNALPELLTLLRAQDSRLSKTVGGLIVRLPFVRWRPLSQNTQRSMALTGFSALGATAKPAVPALIASLNDKDVQIRIHAALCLGSIGPAAEVAVPALVQHLTEPNEMVCDSVENSLGRIHRKPELVIPMLKQRLAGSGKKWTALFALGCFGPEAKEAVPAILPLLNSPDRETSNWAAMSLKQIDPDAAIKAGVK